MTVRVDSGERSSSVAAMHRSAIVLFLGAGLAAQSTLVSPFTRDFFLSSLDGGYYFDLVVRNELRLDRIDLDLFSQYGLQGTVDVYVRPGSWFGNVQGNGDWVRAATAAVTSLGWSQPAPCVLSTPIGLPVGEYALALHVQNLMPAYTQSAAPLSFGNTDLTVGPGGATLQFLQGAPYYWRLFSGALHYTPGGGPYHVATVESHGQGCHQGARSFYEAFAPGNLDLQHQRLRLVPNAAGGYDVTRGAAVPLTLPAGAVNLNLAQNGAAFVPLPTALFFPGGSTATLRVHADGHVALTDRGLLGPAPAQPTPAALFAQDAQVAVACMDLVPGGNDNVYAASDAITGDVTVVWWNVRDSNASTVGNTFAFTARADGSLELAYGNVANPSLPCLVGFGAGLGARDPGPRDLSQIAAFQTQADDPGLGLIATGRPVLGTTTTLSLADRPAQAAFGALLCGWQRLTPPMDLAGFGAAGCQLYVDPSQASWLALGSASTLGLAIPNDPRLLGLSCEVQSAAWSPATVTAPGLVASNALTLTIGRV
jgi:hypothetical protein